MREPTYEVLAPHQADVLCGGKFKKKKEEEAKNPDWERTLRGLTQHTRKSPKSGSHLCYLCPFPSKVAFLHLAPEAVRITIVFTLCKKVASWYFLGECSQQEHS